MMKILRPGYFKRHQAIGCITANQPIAASLLQGVSSSDAAIEFLGKVFGFRKKRKEIKSTGSIFYYNIDIMDNDDFDRICPTADKIVKKPLLKAL